MRICDCTHHALIAGHVGSAGRRASRDEEREGDLSRSTNAGWKRALDAVARPPAARDAHPRDETERRLAHAMQVGLLRRFAAFLAVGTSFAVVTTACVRTILPVRAHPGELALDRAFVSFGQRARRIDPERDGEAVEL